MKKTCHLIFTHTQKLFSSDTIQSMKRRIVTERLTEVYPDAVTCDRMRLIGPNSGQLGPIYYCLLEESQ